MAVTCATFHKLGGRTAHFWTVDWRLRTETDSNQCLGRFIDVICKLAIEPTLSGEPS